MELNIIEIVDREGNLLISYAEEEVGVEGEFIVNNSCKLEVRGDRMLLMIKDYKSKNDSIKLTI